MPFEWFVALRFLREGRAQTALILSGVSVGVGVIVFLTALISGLQTSLIDQTLGSQAHVVVRPPEDAPRVLESGPEVLARVEKAPQRLRSIAQWQKVLAQVRSTPGVVTATPTVNGSAFAVRGNAQRSIALRGVDADTFDRVIPISRHLRSGRFRPTGGETVIGAQLADDLGVSAGDKLRIVTADGGEETFSVSGVFDLGNKDVNSRWVFVSMRAAQTLLDLAGGVSTIEVRGGDVFEAEALARTLHARTALVAESWMTLNAQLLVALQSQNSSSYMIEFFVIIAVGLGIASVLAVSVVQKSREIGILKATGTSTKQVTRIFLLQGALVGVFGAAGGSVLGAALARFFAGLVLNPDGSPRFPVDLGPRLFLSAAAVALITGLVGAVLPARRAARLDPASVIRHG